MLVDTKKLAMVQEIAQRNGGFVTRRQLELAQISKDEIAGWAQSGRLVRLVPSIYRPAEITEAWEIAARAALQWAGDGAALCMGTAAALHGLKGYPQQGPIHLTRPVRWTAPRLCSVEMVAHFHAKLGYWDATMLGDLRVTRVERTLLDLASALTGNQLEDLIDDAMTRGLTQPRFLRACYERLKKPGRRGAGPFGELLRIRGELRLAIEADSREFHSTEKALISDQLRQNDLVSWGWSVLRFRTSQLKDPAAICRIVKAAIAARQEQSFSPEHVAPEYLVVP